jgi:hypothetical protein
LELRDVLAQLRSISLFSLKKFKLNLRGRAKGMKIRGKTESIKKVVLRRFVV